MKEQSTYRIRTELGNEKPINIPVQLTQEFNSFEILSLNINTDDTYRSYTSHEGIVVGRVSTANNGLGIPNVRVSIFVPKGMYSITDEESVIYPFSSPTDTNEDRVRYNLLPSASDVKCYQVIGTLPTKRMILDNETICEVFDKFYKYTTVTNESGDFMLSNIPVGRQRLHIDADLSDIGPFLSQKPYDMIENLGFDKNKFESNSQFKYSNDLNSLAQVISQDKSLFVYPYWGDITENGAEMKITRTDLTLNYEFKTNAVFIGSVITDKQSNSIGSNCTPRETNGKMSDMITGPGRIEMIRKTVSGSVEQLKIKGDALINENGVWCYSIPMNLDYVRTDEFGNIIPTDDPNRGVPTRARVRFRISLNETSEDKEAHKRCSYLVPNNPNIDDSNFLETNDADYSFGSDTLDESFVDLFWNKVYTVKNYVPRIQKTTRPTNRKHTGIKMVNHFGDNNPFPYNSLSIKLNFLYRLICVIVHIIIGLISFLNLLITILGAIPCWLATISIFGIHPFGFAMKFVPKCVAISPEFCDDGVNKNKTYPGCSGCAWNNKTKPACSKEQEAASKNGEEEAVCTNNDTELLNCVENQLAQTNEATSFNFGNDWINGCLYMPLWYRKITPKKSYFFGLFKRSAKDEWCAGEKRVGKNLKLLNFCAHTNKGGVKGKNYEGENVVYHHAKMADACGEKAHEVKRWIDMDSGIVVHRENMFGQTVWYYKAVETSSTINGLLPTEYVDVKGNPMISKILYATDIVLLGSLSDCDLNGIPKLFNYLQPSSYNMPTDVLFTDTEITYVFDENGNMVDQQNNKMSISSGCDWGNKNEYGYEDGGLFYSIGCSTIKMNLPSCVNLRRICELGVGLDDVKYVVNLNTPINSDTDELDYDNNEYWLRPDGYISYDDIVGSDYRSMFATMNGNNLKTKINRESGVKEYDFRYLYIDNFDGSARDFMSREENTRTKANYRYNFNLEETNIDYMTFRLGDKPFYYDGKSLVADAPGQGKMEFGLPKYRNSFYFYFGLKEGKTAIDLFNDKYNQPCNILNEVNGVIPYKAVPNGWCSMDTDGTELYNHSTHDGYLGIDLSALPKPCTAILNSKTNDAVTYTIRKYDNNDSGDIDYTIGEDLICFYGENNDRYNNSGYTRYAFKYENPLVGANVDKCFMLNNGNYSLIVTDADGNYHSFDIKMNNEYLSFKDEVRSFKQPNDVLKSYYNNSYWKVMYAGDIQGHIDDATPIIGRNDSSKCRLNGTICLYDIICANKNVESFLVEMEPYDKDDNGQPLDEELMDEAQKNVYQWDKIKAYVNLTDDGYVVKPCIILSDALGEYTKTQNYQTTPFSAPEIKWGDNNDKNFKCVVINCPKGDVDYRVRVTELCEKNGKNYKTQNYVEKRVFVAQPTPYKLYINDVDYDIIKRFKTGWTLKDKAKQTDPKFISDKTTPDIVDVNFTESWLKLSDVNNTYYDWGVNKKMYGEGKVNKDEYNKYLELLTQEPSYDVVELTTNGNQITTSYRDGLICYDIDEEKNRHLYIIKSDIDYGVWNAVNIPTTENKLKYLFDTTENVLSIVCKGKGYTEIPQNGKDEFLKNFNINNNKETIYYYKNAIRCTVYKPKEGVNQDIWDKIKGFNCETKIEDKKKYLFTQIKSLPYGSEEINSEIYFTYEEDVNSYSLYIPKVKADESKIEVEGGLTDDNIKDYFDKTTISDYVSANYYTSWSKKLDKYKELAFHYENRLAFIAKMKDAFWLTSESEPKNLTFSVRTDDTPYLIYTFYNAEIQSMKDEEAHECESEKKKNDRNKWILTHTTDRYISDIKIPTVTSMDSEEFGCQNDAKRKKNYKNTFNTTKGICFAQDNIAEFSDDQGISIKTPYYIMCVNSEGITKPDNLPKGDKGFFKEENGVYVVNKDNLVIKQDNNELFGFHIIDKIFKPQITYWPYINGIPQYKRGGEYVRNEIVKNDPRVKCEGIMSGYIYNGNSDSGIYNYVMDFEEKKFFGSEITLKTLNDENDLPTKRLILYQGVEESSEDGEVRLSQPKRANKKSAMNGIVNGSMLMGASESDNSDVYTYRNYIHCKDEEPNQYKPVLNKEGEMNLIDYGSSAEINKTIYGSMKISIKGDYISDPKGKKKNRTLAVSLVNCSSDNVMYYIFKLKKKEDDSKGVNYPLNDASYDEEQERWYFDCKDKIGPWDSNHTDGAYLFNNQTSKQDFENKKCNAKSKITKVNTDGEEEEEDTKGYGETGVFTNLDKDQYFVIATTQDGGRCISPVYDFSPIKCTISLRKLQQNNNDDDDQYELAVTLKDVVVDVKDKAVPAINNYYIACFSYTMEIVFDQDDVSFQESMTFERSENVVYTINPTDQIKNIGEQYYTPGILYTYTGGTIENMEDITMYIAHSENVPDAKTIETQLKGFRLFKENDTFVQMEPSKVYCYLTHLSPKGDATDGSTYDTVYLDEDNNLVFGDDELPTPPEGATLMELSPRGVKTPQTYYYYLEKLSELDYENVPIPEEENSSEEEEDDDRDNIIVVKDGLSEGQKCDEYNIVVFKYVNYESEKVGSGDNSPIRNHFDKSLRKILTKSEYNKVKKKWKKMNVYVTDYVGLKHKCEISKGEFE